MQPRERDAWFAERFGYGIRQEVVYEDIKHCALLKKDGNIVDYPAFTAGIFGAFKLKAEMVKLGWNWNAAFYVDEYKVTFDRDKPNMWAYSRCDITEIEATWKAAALALLGEG